MDQIKLGAALVWIGLACAATRAQAGPGPCTATIHLEGEADLVAPIARVLKRHGIGDQAGTAGTGCPLLRARIERRGELLGVTIVELVRHSDRLVADAETAATVIESWARSDISAPLLSARPLALRAAAPPPPPLPSAPVAPPPRPRFAVSVLAEFSAGTNGTDSSEWLGARVHGCLLLGPIRLGLLFRMAGDIQPSRLGDLLMQRLGTDLLLAADLPLDAGRLTVSPGVGLGIGWLRTSLLDDDGDRGSISDGGLRADVHLVLSLRLWRGLFADGALSLSGAFLGSGDTLLDLPLRMRDPAEKMAMDMGLTAPPWGLLRTGLGLRWSSP